MTQDYRPGLHSGRPYGTGQPPAGVSYLPRQRSKQVFLCAQVVTNICAADPKDDIFCDVGGVIANPLQVARDHQRMQSLGGETGLLFNQI